MTSPISASIRRVKFWDKVAKYVITSGGVMIILTVIGILLLIFQVTLPLFGENKITFLGTSDPVVDAPNSRFLVGVGDYMETSYVVDDSGGIGFFDIKGYPESKSTKVERIHPGKEFRAATPHGRHRYTIMWQDGTSSLIKVGFKPEYLDDGRKIKPYFNVLHTTSEAMMAEELELREVEDGFMAFAFQKDGGLLISKLGGSDDSDDLFGGAGEEGEASQVRWEPPFFPVKWAVNSEASRVAVAGPDGQIAVISVDGEPEILNQYQARASAPLASMGFVFGGRTLVTATVDGESRAWGVINRGDDGKVLRSVKKLPSLSGLPQSMGFSVRNKAIISLNTDGTIMGDYLTTGDRLFTAKEQKPLLGISLAARNNGLIGLTRDGGFQLWALDIPHPEINFKTLFRSVFYEGYDEPSLVWQSTGGSDEFEPKLSIMPLVFGTIKATIYAMMMAIPLSLLGALYTSQFASPSFRAFVKPTVELMAGVPSVVVGFILALWLAPFLQNWFVSLLVSILLMVVVFTVFLGLWQLCRGQVWAKSFERGYEVVLILPLIIMCLMFGNKLGPIVESSLFDGNFLEWIYTSTGTPYDQRNSIVIAFGLGFAVIPIIFSIAEDAISSVPPSLTAASLALGASRWQTVWKVVLPSASPGIFVAAMMGFGRAVGETMIVLMATGNTPIMDWNPLAGMRTLSANIAVEVAEAPMGGTLYRTLFLCAVILFCFTFILNTGGELVRHKLRQKYGRF